MPDKDNLHKRLRLRVATHACHESARASIAKAIEDSVLRLSRLHYYAYVCEHPVMWIEKENATPRLTAPFIDHEIARRTLSLNLPISSTSMDLKRYIKKIKEAIKEYRARRGFSMPLAFTNLSNLHSLWDRYSLLGSITETTIAHYLFEKWKTDRTKIDGIAEEKAFHPKDCVEDMEKKLNSTKLADDEKIAYANLFALLYYALMTSHNPDDCLRFVAAPLCTRRTFYGLLMAVIETLRIPAIVIACSGAS
ncbi:MAG: hypothetical protein ACREBU_17620 [Nitrososphaera sp.]